MWRQFLYYTKAEKQGLIVLMILLLVVLCANGYLLWERKNSSQEVDDTVAKEEYESFLRQIKTNEKSARPATRSIYKKPEPVLKDFDPNTIDSVSLISLGLPPWMAGNVLKYRTKGGKFRKAEDFSKIYGLSREQYLALKPYIAIAEERILQKDLNHQVPALAEKVETTPKVFKYPAGTVINLNKADTTELKKIPGIGSATAKRIISYRKKLGGFYRVEQLTEIDAGKFLEWFTVDIPEITKININKAGVEQLRTHPYINFYQAKAIVEYRRKRGKITRLSQLSLLEEFTEKDFERMEEYIEL